MLDYHRAWFTMMRCPDGSFVVQPGRDYADGGYYISSRANPTAVMALVLGLGYPKLLIQGTQVSIPGVNPKALRGSLLAAYKAIGSKSYGKAAVLLKSAGPAGAPMAEYLDDLAGRALLPPASIEDKVDLERAIAALRKTWAGVARFDRESKDLQQKLSTPQ
jgi:hypothetical protein